MNNPPDLTLSPGWVWKAVCDPRWKLLEPPVECTCAHRGCTETADAELDREMGHGQHRLVPFCGAHLFGRWIENGCVMGWVRYRKVAEVELPFRRKSDRLIQSPQSRPTE